MIESIEYMIPTPMPAQLFATIKIDLGLETAKMNEPFL